MAVAATSFRDDDAVCDHLIENGFQPRRFYLQQFCEFGSRCRGVVRQILNDFPFLDRSLDALIQTLYDFGAKRVIMYVIAKTRE